MTKRQIFKEFKKKMPHSYTSVERCMDLPFGSIKKWEKGRFPKDAEALIRILTMFPRIIYVADANFEKNIAKSELLRHIADLIVIDSQGEKK